MKKRVVLEVDDCLLFDTLKKMRGDTSAIGNRLVAILLSEQVSLSTAIGLGVYGVEVEDITPLVEPVEVKMTPASFKGVPFQVIDEGSGP